MAEWGMSMAEAEQLPERHALHLMRAYAERKRFEARVLIAQLGEALAPKRETATLGELAMMGFGIRGT